LGRKERHIGMGKGEKRRGREPRMGEGQRGTERSGWGPPIRIGEGSKIMHSEEGRNL